MRRLGGVLLIALATVSLAACGSGGGGTREDLADGFSVRAALGSLPEVSGSGDDPVTVQAADLDALSRAAGAERGGNGTAAVAEWGAAVARSRAVQVVPEDLGMAYPADEVREVLGFDVGDVTRFAAVGPLPKAITVVRLREGASLRQGVKATGSAPVGDIDQGAQDSLDGGPFPVVLGVGERDGSVAVAHRASMLSAWRTGEDTMADDDHLGSVAAALDQHHPYAAILVGGEVRRPPMPASALRTAKGVPDYDAVGVAGGTEDGHGVVYVAYAPKKTYGAKDAIEEVWRSGTSVVTREPLSSLATVVDVAEHDGVVVVTLRPRRSASWAHQMIDRGDTPFLVLR